MKKGLKITLIVLGSLVGFILLVLLLVSLLAGPIAKSYVNGHGEELVGRRMSVEKVGLNLFSGHLSINGLDIYEEDKTTSFAGFDTLDVSLRLLALMAKEVYVNHITLAGLHLNAEQNGSTFNFTSMLDHFKSDDTLSTPKDTTPSEWIVNLHQIHLRNGNLSYTDVPRGSHWGLNHLDLLVPDFCIGGKQNTNGGLSLMLSEGGSLNADLGYDPESNDFTLRLALDQFLLEQVQPYLTDMTNIEHLGGRLNVHADVVGNLDVISQMTIKGDVSVEDLDVIDNNGRSVAGIGNLSLLINNVNLGENRYDIQYLVIDGLTTEYHVYDGHNTVSDLLKPAKPAVADTASKAAEPKTAEPAKPMNFTLAQFELKNSNLTYADHTLPEDFVFPVKNINITSTNMSMTGDNNANLRASLPGGAHAMIRWHGNISDWKKNQSIDIRIKNLHLTEFNPYMLAYLGQPFKDGTFSFVSSNRINNSELQGKNQVDIYKATIDKRRKDVDAKMRLPLKAALYILKDKDEKIILDVPISGNIDKPEFNYMKLVWKTLGNLIVKVATSPFRGSSDGLQDDGNGGMILPIDVATPDFTSEQFYNIDRIADMAIQDETMSLSFEQQVPADADSTYMKRVEIRNRILSSHLKQLGVPEERLSITNAALPADSQPRYIIRSKIEGLEMEEGQE